MFMTHKTTNGGKTEVKLIANFCANLKNTNCITLPLMVKTWILRGKSQGSEGEMCFLLLFTDPELSRSAQRCSAEKPRQEAGSWEGQRRPAPEPEHPNRGLRWPHVFPREPEQTGIQHGSRKHWLLTLVHSLIVQFTWFACI